MNTNISLNVTNEILEENANKISSFALSQGVASPEALFFFPKYILIETISLCNARCVMCPVNDVKRDIRTMSPELFEKIISEVKDYTGWIERVTINLNGEPLLDKSLEDKITRLKEINVKYVTFTTNGSLMTSARAESLLRSGLDNIDFSIDGATKETYESIRGNLNYDVVFNNIKQFLKIRDEIKPQVSVRLRMTVSENNIHEFKPLSEYWKPYFGPHDGVYGKLISSWASWMDGYALPEGHDPSRLNTSPCISLWGTLPIFSDGRVPICCTDFNAKVTLGDVNQSTIREIWQGSVMSKLRDMHIEQGRATVETCNDCFVWEDTTRVG